MNSCTCVVCACLYSHIGQIRPVRTELEGQAQKMVFCEHRSPVTFSKWWFYAHRSPATLFQLVFGAHRSPGTCYVLRVQVSDKPFLCVWHRSLMASVFCAYGSERYKLLRATHNKITQRQIFFDVRQHKSILLSPW